MASPHLLGVSMYPAQGNELVRQHVVEQRRLVCRLARIRGTLKHQPTIDNRTSKIQHRKLTWKNGHLESNNETSTIKKSNIGKMRIDNRESEIGNRN